MESIRFNSLQLWTAKTELRVGEFQGRALETDASECREVIVAIDDAHADQPRLIIGPTPRDRNLLFLHPDGRPVLAGRKWLHQVAHAGSDCSPSWILRALEPSELWRVEIR